MPRIGQFLRAMSAVLAVSVFVAAGAASAFAQCAMCRAALLNSRGGAELIEGLRQGIVLLLAIPLLITATVLIRLKRAARVSKGVSEEGAAVQRVHAGESLLPGHAASD